MQEIINSISVLGIPVLPVIVIVFLTEAIKRSLYTNLVDRLKQVLTFFTPLFLSALVHLIFSLPDFEIWKYLGNVTGTWAIAALGFDGVKALFFPVAK